MLEAMILVVFPLLVAYAAATDFLVMQIANRVSILLIFSFIGLALAVGLPPAMIGMHFAAAFTVFAVGFVLFLTGKVGGGDVKFAAAVALWLGWDQLLPFILLFSSFGGVLSVGCLLAADYLRRWPILQVGFLAGFHQKRKVPYGIALATAALAIYPLSPIMRTLM